MNRSIGDRPSRESGERRARVHGPEALSRAARRSLDAVVRAGAEAYRRERHLPSLIPIEPGRLAEMSVETHRGIVARLARALRAERNRGRAGHWTYDLNRHIGLRQAYTAERRLLAERTGERPGTRHG